VVSELEDYGPNDIADSPSVAAGVATVIEGVSTSGTASSSNGGQLPQEQTDNHQELKQPPGSQKRIDAAQKLTDAGLWTTVSVYEHMRPKHRAWLSHRQQSYLRLESLPLNMSVLPAAHGLTLSVAPAGTADLDEAVSKAAAAANAATSIQKAAAARPAASDGQSSSRSSKGPLPKSASGGAVTVDLDAGQPLPPNPLQVTSYDLHKENREQRIINLNSQLRHAAAAQHHQQVVDLFNSLISQGLAAAEEQRQQQQQPQGILPRQYRARFRDRGAVQQVPECGASELCTVSRVLLLCRCWWGAQAGGVHGVVCVALDQGSLTMQACS